MPQDDSKHRKYPLPHYENPANDGKGGGDVMRMRTAFEKMDTDVEALIQENKTLKAELRKMKKNYRENHNGNRI